DVFRSRVDAFGAEGRLDVGGPTGAIRHIAGHATHDLGAYLRRRYPWSLRSWPCGARGQQQGQAPRGGGEHAGAGCRDWTCHGRRILKSSSSTSARRARRAITGFTFAAGESVIMGGCLCGQRVLPTMHPPAGLQALIDDGVIDEVLRPLKSGKEAAVYVVRAGNEMRCAKVYKDMAQRSFQQRAQYQEGRKVRGSRQARAMGKASKFGRKEAE